MITKKEIAKLCDYAVGTVYEPLLEEIKKYTSLIEDLYEQGEYSNSLLVFRQEFSQRFYNLFSILFEPISKLEPLPESGKLYYITPASTYSTIITQTVGMSSCTFIDLMPYSASTTNKRLMDSFVHAVNSKLPTGYEVEFVCNTSNSYPIVTTINDGLLYIVESCKHDYKKIHLKLLSGYSAQNIPMAILTDKQCAENHAQSFVVGFIELFNMYYPNCQWRYLTKEFKNIVWGEYCKYISEQEMVSQRYINSQLTEFASNKHKFESSPLALFADAQQVLKLQYMATFCEMYSATGIFPQADAISTIVNKIKS